VVLRAADAIFDGMIRRRSLLSSSLALFTALSTVWCLGCCAYEPLVAALITGSAAQGRCAQDNMSIASTGNDASGQSGVVSSTETNQSTTQFECQCLSCVAPPPAQAAASPLPPVHPQVAAGTATTPLSISHQPLVRPPVALS
jgi:hypothetical protein